MTNENDPKRVAGRRAAEMVETGMVVGLGTGSTVFHTLVRLAERIQSDGLEIRGIPTSKDTEAKAADFGIPLVSFEDVHELDLTIDGADEAEPGFCLTKGGGGALLREKVVAYASRRVVIVLTPSKRVVRLGDTFPLPVEVLPFALPMVSRELTKLGAEALERRDASQGSYRTDNGCAILDCRFPGGIEDPIKLEAQIDRIPGVVESGLFCGLAHALVVGDESGQASVVEQEA